MTTVEGGLRARLIRDSIEALVHSGLAARGWFDPGRRHSPLRIVAEPNDWDQPVEANSISISGGDSADDPLEMGSNATEDQWTYYVDFYAEDESIGLDVSGEVRDIFRGKLPGIGRTDPSLPVYDFRDATPAVAFVCQIENVVVDRGRGFNQPWLRFWYTVRLDLLDEHYG